MVRQLIVGETHIQLFHDVEHFERCQAAWVGWQLEDAVPFLVRRVEKPITRGTILMNPVTTV